MEGMKIDFEVSFPVNKLSTKFKLLLMLSPLTEHAV